MAEKKETKAPAKKSPAQKLAKPKVAKVPAKMGRPSEFTPENREAIYTLIKAGCSYPTAAMTIGISKTLIYQWMNRGTVERNRIQAGLEPIPTEVDFLDFLNGVERKKEEFIASQIVAITKAGTSGDWRAAAWLLERARPNEFGKTEQIIHTGAEGGDIKVSINVGDLENKIQMILSKRTKAIDE